MDIGSSRGTEKANSNIIESTVTYGVRHQIDILFRILSTYMCAQSIRMYICSTSEKVLPKANETDEKLVHKIGI